MGTVTLVMLFFVVVAVAGTAMATEKDRGWLPLTVAAAYLVKLVGSTARYWVLEVVYGGKGDATGYHGAGLRLSDTWRSFEVPTIERTGTEVVDAITGLLYIPYQPSKLGGFFLFATLAFLGQLLLYAAFRYSFPSRHLKWYAFFIFFWPTIVYWPSSIGKESLMLLMIGITSYGAARLLTGYNPLWIGVVALGLAGAGIVRLHISLLLAGSIVAALLFAKAPSVPGAQARRIGMVGLAGVGLALVASLTAQSFGVDLTTAVSLETASDEVGEVLAGVESQTSKGGSAVSGEAVGGIADVPEALLRVLFRPLPYEATNAQLLVASLEGALLLGLVLWRLPWILRNLLRIRRYPYAVYSAVFTGGFIFAFSSVLNLGILSRQRSQMMPFFLALLVALGSRHPEDPVETSETDRLPRPREQAVAGVSSPLVGPGARRAAEEEVVVAGKQETT
jgi:hypothetical protein